MIRTTAATGEDEDAVAEREPVAAGVQLARQVAVPGEDRAEHREAVEGGVGGQDEDEPGAAIETRRTPSGKSQKTASASWPMTVSWT